MRQGKRQQGVFPVARRCWAAVAWACSGLALFAFFTRISFGSLVDSDGANNALQAWDLLHGNILLHGWFLGDATFYTFELPLNAFTELLFGVGSLAFHTASALAYLIVTVCAMALAVTGSRGPARAARGAVVVAVLAAPLLATPVVRLLLEDPDHIGTSAFLLAAFLLIDRAPGRRFAAGPDLVRGPAQRPDRPLRGGAGDRDGVRLPGTGGAEAPFRRRGTGGGRRGIRAA